MDTQTSNIIQGGIDIIDEVLHLHGDVCETCKYCDNNAYDEYPCNDCIAGKQIKFN